MKYDCVVIGAGISGLTAASLLAKRGLSVAVCEHAAKPGGCCGIFKRQIKNTQAVFDQGSSMLFGFGPQGFNAHRFLFNCLEEPFAVIRHENLYAVNYDGSRIVFTQSIDEFIKQLSELFPKQSDNIKRFYADMEKLYNKVISENPSYTTPDETDISSAIKGIMTHPISYIKFLSYLNISAEKLLRRYFDDERILRFFDKLTSTYCYATLKEAPAVLASVMFIDNHIGGSWYPAGSTLFLPGIMEKVIEENNGRMYYDTTVSEILFDLSSRSSRSNSFPRATGVLLESGDALRADNVIFSGTVWDLYGKLLPSRLATEEMTSWASSQQATYSATVLYLLVKREAVPEDACAIEMLASAPGVIDESEVTVYIPSIDDHTLCDESHHVMIAIGPALSSCHITSSAYSEENYRFHKLNETARIISVLESRFPKLKENILHSELATPFTIERYTLKKSGSAAGPKQMLGQHMLKRQSIKTAWPGLYCCGESTTMGTGTPTVTLSGIAAANAILKKCGKKPYLWHKNMKNYVAELKAPVRENWLFDTYPVFKAEIMTKASRCLFCENPACCSKELLDIPGIMRRASCGNFKGAAYIIDNAYINITDSFLAECERKCTQSPLQRVEDDLGSNNLTGNVEISAIFDAIMVL